MDLEFNEENEAVNCMLQVVCRNKIVYLSRNKTDRDTKRRRKDVPQANNTAQVWNTLLREEECSEWSVEHFVGGDVFKTFFFDASWKPLGSRYR